MKIVEDVFAAVTTPRSSTGSLDMSGLKSQLSFLLDAGISGFALLGATGEFSSVDLEEFRQIASLAATELGDKASVVYGIGSGSYRESLLRGEIAAQAGAKAVLLPMPWFFPYQQDDVLVFCTEIARQLPVPVLLYNLPQFTTAMETETVESILRSEPNVAGIKDSSGSLDILRKLTSTSANRVLGNDAVLAGALHEGILDGVISGVAGVLPELVIALYQEPSSSERFAFLERALADFSSQIACLPTPWGLKFIGGKRGLFSPDFSLPLSAKRTTQLANLDNWFEEWCADLSSHLDLRAAVGRP